MSMFSLLALATLGGPYYSQAAERFANVPCVHLACAPVYRVMDHENGVVCYVKADAISCVGIGRRQ